PFTTLKMTELRWILPLKPKAGLNGPPAIYSLRMYAMPTSRKSGEKWGTLSCDGHRREAGHLASAPSENALMRLTLRRQARGLSRPGMESQASPFATLKMTELRWILPLKPKAGLNGPPASDLQRAV